MQDLLGQYSLCLVQNCDCIVESHATTEAR